MLRNAAEVGPKQLQLLVQDRSTGAPRVVPLEPTALWNDPVKWTGVRRSGGDLLRRSE